MSQYQKLAYLRHLLENLPDSVPSCDTKSTGYCFAVNNDNIDTYGNENSATNHMLEITFGLRHGTDGIVPIKERGQGICAVVPILEK